MPRSLEHFWLDRAVAFPCLAIQLALDLPLFTARGEGGGGGATVCLYSWTPGSMQQGIICFAPSSPLPSSHFRYSASIDLSPLPFHLQEASSKKEHLRSRILSVLEKGQSRGW